LRISLTDSYAASKKLPIITGCFFEWRLADNNIQGAAPGIKMAMLFFYSGFVVAKSLNISVKKGVEY